MATNKTAEKGGVAVADRAEDAKKASMRTAETLLRLLPVGLCVAALVLMLKNSQTNQFGSVFYSDLGAFKYLVYANGVCAGYSLLSSVVTAVPRPFTMSRAWTFFLLDQVFTYAIIAAGAVSTEVVYLAYNGDTEISWSEACGTFGGFCKKATVSVSLTFIVAVCYISLSLISSYRLFTRYDPPPTAQPYGAPPYGAPPHKDDHSHSSSGSGYPTAQPYGKPDKPPKDDYYSHSSPGSGYPSAPPSQYGSSYGGKPDKPPKDSYSHSSAGPGYPSAPPSQYGSAPPYGKPDKPPKDDYYSHQSQYGGSGSSPFAALMPSTFPPGTDPTVVACFQVADQDGSGLIDDKELQGALSSYNQSFSLRTVHLLMVLFTSSNSRKIGPKEFTSLFYALQSWREIFERFDKDRSGKIDAPELRDALYSLGYAVSPVILDLLVSKFDKTGGKHKAIEYDNFIECCLTVKGLTDKFKEKDTQYRGSATFTYEEFMLTVLPYLVA